MAAPEPRVGVTAVNLTLMLCTNDTHGNLTDRIHALEVSAAPGDVLLSLECLDGDHYEQDERGHRVSVGHQWFAVKSGFATSVGNACWNAVEIHPGTLAALLNSLQQRDMWDCTEGDAALFEAWDAGRPFTGEMLVQAAGSELETPTQQARRELVEYAAEAGGQD